MNWASNKFRAFGIFSDILESMFLDIEYFTYLYLFANWLFKYYFHCQKTLLSKNHCVKEISASSNHTSGAIMINFPAKNAIVSEVWPNYVRYSMEQLICLRQKNTSMPYLTKKKTALFIWR